MARSRSRKLRLSYFRCLPRFSRNTESRRFCHDWPITDIALLSSRTRVGSGGWSSMISKPGILSESAIIGLDEAAVRIAHDQTRHTRRPAFSLPTRRMGVSGSSWNRVCPVAIHQPRPCRKHSETHLSLDAAESSFSIKHFASYPSSP